METLGHWLCQTAATNEYGFLDSSSVALTLFHFSGLFCSRIKYYHGQKFTSKAILSRIISFMSTAYLSLWSQTHASRRSRTHNFAVWLLNGCNKADWLCVFGNCTSKKHSLNITFDSYGLAVESRQMPIKFIWLQSHCSLDVITNAHRIKWWDASKTLHWHSFFCSEAGIFNFKVNFVLNIFLKMVF